jgi:hypothetical protein
MAFFRHQDLATQTLKTLERHNNISKQTPEAVMATLVRTDEQRIRGQDAVGGSSKRSSFLSARTGRSMSENVWEFNMFKAPFFPVITYKY